jgi:tetratricopeptide (TPR) repeat protein
MALPLLLLLWLTLPPCRDAQRLEAEQVGARSGRAARAAHIERVMASCEPDAAFMSHAALYLAEAAQQSRNRRLMPEAYRLARQAVRANPGGAFGYEILSDVIAIDVDLSNLYRKAVLADSIRHYAAHALALDPSSAKAAYILGRWHFEVASLPFYAASARALVTPESTPGSIAEAVRYLERAYRLNPDPEIRDWLDRARAKSR